jgi:hypothetical protein
MCDNERENFPEEKPGEAKLREEPPVFRRSLHSLTV